MAYAPGGKLESYCAYSISWNTIPPKDGELAVGTVLPVSLTVDHRIVDGGTSSRFVNAFLSYVKNPVDLFIR